jgi:hypothetical protein
MSRARRLSRAAAACGVAGIAAAASLLILAPAAHGQPRDDYVAATPAAAAAASAARPTAGAAPPGTLHGSTAAAVPLLAYYYIWFDANSWNRAKTDYPLLGKYSSDDASVMRRQIKEAKSAGIDGFIVSWKDTATNDQRLRLLMGVARQEHFKLAMIYQGLDFRRHPLPLTEVAADFMTFMEKYASDPVFFRLAGKPLTIWSGTWAYSHAAVGHVTGPVRGRMLVLSTEKNVLGYQRISNVTDGDAYYWSSVNPATNSFYGAKLDQMSAAVHRAGQYWIAPFAPGFDARMVGGSRMVRRDNGQTLRNEYGTAVASSPDVLGLISWNEFSENSYVEPSQKFGHQYLDVLHELRGTTVPAPVTVNPSDLGITGSASPPGGYLPAGLRLAGFALLLVGGVGAIGYARRRAARRGPAGNRPRHTNRHQLR